MSDEKLWDDEVTLTLIRLLYNYALEHGRRRPDLSDWDNWSAHLKCVTGKEFTTAQLSGKRDRLRGLYNAFQKLKSNIGLGWNLILKTVTCSKEFWREYVKKNPKAYLLRHGGILGEEMLDVVFGKGTATDIGQYGSGHTVALSIDVSDDDDDGNVGLVGGSNDHIPRPGPSFGNKSRVIEEKKKKPSISNQARCLNAMELIADSISAGHSNNSGGGSTNSLTLRQRCQDIVEQMGVDDDTYYKALDGFSANPHWCEYFVNMVESRRYNWLMTKLAQHQSPPTTHYYPETQYRNPPSL